MLKLLLSGYYGFGNTGDEAILDGIARHLRRFLPDACIRVISGNPDMIRDQHGLEAVHCTNLPRVWRWIRESDAFIVGGGGLLQDVTSRCSLIYYLALIYLACLSGTRVFFYTQGLGPVRGRIARWLTGNALSRGQAFYARDVASAAMAAELAPGLAEKGLLFTAPDPAYTLTPERSGRVEAIRRCTGIRRKRVLLVSLRPWPQLDLLLARWMRQLGAWAQEKNLFLLWVPFHRPADLEICREGMRLAGGQAALVTEDLTPGEVLALYDGLSGVVGMRLHSLVFAALAGVPFAALSYDPKVYSFVSSVLREAGLDWVDKLVVDMNGSSREGPNLTDALDFFWQHRDPLQVLLSAHARGAVRQTSAPACMLARLLAGE